MAGCVRARKLNMDDEWLRPTLLAMAFDAGDVTLAEDLADEIAREGATPWRLQTLLDDLDVSVGQQANSDVKQKLTAVLVRLKALL